MIDIAEIGRRHLADALTGEMQFCDVSEWLDEAGEPIRVYWRPLTGAQQKQIDQFNSLVERTCMTVKVRALSADGARIFAKTPIESLVNDFDYEVIRAIAYLMAIGTPADTGERIEALAKESDPTH